MKWFVFFYALSLFAATSVVTRWTLPAEGRYQYESTQERTRPIVVGEILYHANGRGDVYALHRLEGYVLWHKKLSAPVEGALTYGRSKLFVGDVSGNLYALNARDGSESWKLKITSEWLSPPAVFRDKVYVTSSADETYALTESHGKELWHFAHRGDEKMTVRGMGAPTVFGKRVYQGYSDGSLVALSAEDGRPLWVKKLKSRDRFYDVDTTPYVDETSVIAASFDGKLYNLNPTNGSVKWVFAAGVYGDFLVNENSLVVAGLNGFLYLLDKNNSSVRWKVPFSGGLGVSPVAVGQNIALTTSGDPVRLFSAADGSVIWEKDLGAGTLAGAASVGLADGWFYAVSNYGNLFAFELVPSSSPSFQESLSTPSAVIRYIGERRKNS